MNPGKPSSATTPTAGSTWTGPCLHQMIEAQVARTPNAAAVRCDGRQLSFLELDRRANQCAHFLRGLGVGPDSIVAVLMERSLDLIVGLLGILKAGGAYLPLDPAYPEERLQLLLDDADVGVLVTQEAFAGMSFDGTLLPLDRDRPYLAREPETAPVNLALPHHLAYVIYTSGSTGKPKGCMLPHRAIGNRLDWMQRCYNIGAGDRILQKTPYTFDVSVWELFLPLLSGACLVFAKPDGHKDAAYLVDLIQQEKVTVCHFVPSMLRFFLNQPRVRHCTSLRHVFASGEALPADLVAQWTQKCSGKLHNLYGPTEAAVDVSFWECSLRADGKVPIGRAIDNIQLHVLDEYLRPVPLGEAGELFIGGVGLARGYLRRPELTAQRFVRDPFSDDPEARLYKTGDLACFMEDGNIEYLGRSDDQVKLRGFRIELGEIEWALRQHDAVVDAAVAVVARETGDPKLAGYVVPMAAEAVSSQELKDFLKGKLPEYMVPNQIGFLDELPISRHGKLDRNALPWPMSQTTAPPQPAPEQAPRQENEACATAPAAAVLDDLLAEVADITRGFIEVAQLNVDDDLFDLGATSLTLVLLVEALQARYGVAVPVDVMMDGPNVRHIARYLADHQTPTAAAQAMPIAATATFAAPTVAPLEAAPLPARVLRAPAPCRHFSATSVPRRACDGLLAELRRIEVDGQHRYLYASAGDLNPVQTYLVVRENGVADLAAGVYYHHPVRHCLLRLGDGCLPRAVFADADQTAAANAGFAVFLIARMDAVTPIYKGTAAMLSTVEAGYIGGLLQDRAADVALGVCPVVGVDPAPLSRLFDLDDDHQFLFCLLAGVPAAQPAATADATRALPAGFSDYLAVDADAVAFPSAEDKARLRAEQRHLRRVSDEPVVPLAELPVPGARYRARACKRSYLATAVDARRLAGWLALTGVGDRAGAYHGLDAVPASLQAYIYICKDRVAGLAPGLYRYERQSQVLQPVTGELSAPIKNCYTPFNRKHAGAAAFHLFLIAPLGSAQGAARRDAEYPALLEAGYLGRLLLDRQADFGLGVCPIGGLLFDKIRGDFGINDGDVLVHGFVGGDYAYDLPVDWDAGLALVSPPVAKPSRDMAIVGLAGRYPGADDTAAFAANLKAGVTAFSMQHFNGAGDYRNGDEKPRAQQHFAGFLSNVAGFDAALFKMLPVEARGVDPQERLLLETVWTCLEEAGTTGAALSRAVGRVGVFTGVMWNDYQLHGCAGWREGRYQTVSLPSSLANRISHAFGFKGPSVAVNTSCSAAMTALHYACHSVRSGECGAAVVAGVNLITHPNHLGLLASLGFLSNQGVCRPFGLKADGWVAGEGVGAILIKPLRAAEEQGDHIHGVIKGTAVAYSGQDGRFGAPSLALQRESMQQALADAGLTAADIDYVEAAAPGAGMADALEAGAIKDVFGERRDAVRVGSVKANIGHLESASAMSQLTKVLLQFKENCLFPTLNLSPVNPMVPTGANEPALVSDLQVWPPSDQPRRALINAFGATGSSGHLVLEEYRAPAPKEGVAPATPSDQACDHLLLFSAADGEALKKLATRWRDWPALPSINLADAAFTLRVGRVAQRARLAMVVSSHQALVTNLDAFINGQAGATTYYGEGDNESPPEVTATSSLHDLAQCWVAAGTVDLLDHPALQSATRPRRLSLPTYAFDRRTYWVPDSDETQAPIRAKETPAKSVPAPTPVAAAMPASTTDDGRLLVALMDYLKSLFARVTELPTSAIQAKTGWDAYGVNSLIITRFNACLAEDFDQLPATLFFEYQSLATLAGYFLEHRRNDLLRLFPEAAQVQTGPAPLTPSRPVAAKRATAPGVAQEDVAIIGVAGRYPKAADLDTFWHNLVNGVDCISEIPEDRWDLKHYYRAGKAQPGKMTSKWGGFIDDVACFDPLFFQISPSEAKALDPQERLFLQTAYHTFEDAGYNREHLAGSYAGRIGVFVGVMYAEYQRFSGAGGPVIGTCYGSIANRVSHFFDLHGPSMAVDTLCSSSLTALHLAVQSVQRGECAAALAGGVNLSLHPDKYIMQSQLGMIAGDGRCRSFGAGGDGLVPGEGVGAVLIKPLSQALADGDSIYAVVKGSAVNHDGRTQGYTVPNPNAQAALIAQAVRTSGVDPADIGFIEAHGTGTPLGDPIEIAGLNKAFAGRVSRCALGSVKSNLGHLEAAAGVVAVTKILLQFKHGMLAPTLHIDRTNANIDFSDSPFQLQREAAPWPRRQREQHGRKQTLPRLACVSSFGASGANAHFILAEHLAAPATATTWEGPLPFVFSATDETQLRVLVGNFVAWLERDGADRPALVDVAYTLQVGRDALPQRLAVQAASYAALTTALSAYLDGRDHRVTLGRVQDDASLVQSFSDDADLRETVGKWLARRKFEPLLPLWVKGLSVEWAALYGAQIPRRVALPAYPFRKDRCWLFDQRVAEAKVKRLHPLVAENISSFREQGYALTDTELPLTPAALLEAARFAVDHTWQLQNTRPVAAALHLHALEWGVSTSNEALCLRLQELADRSVAWCVAPRDDDERVLVRGQADLVAAAPAPLALAALQAQLTAVSPPDAAWFAACFVGEQQRLLQLQTGEAAETLLDPALLEVLVEDAARAQGRLGWQALWVYRAGQAAWCYQQADDDGVTLELVDGDGELLVRALLNRDNRDNCDNRDGSCETTLVCRPSWRDVAAETDATAATPARRLLLLCEPEHGGHKQIPRQVGGLQAQVLKSAESTVSERYRDLALQLFEVVKAAVQERGKQLLQVVVPAGAVWQTLQGLGALLKTARLENAQLSTQLITWDMAAGFDGLAACLDQDARCTHQHQIRYSEGRRQVAVWKKLENAESLIPWCDRGVYLITGGLGGLGLLFAQHIATHRHGCRLILTGRSALAAAKQDRVESLRALGAEVVYREVDVCRREAVDALLADIEQQFGALNGVLHAAGTVQDHLIPHKKAAEFKAVLAPKVMGTNVLDLATKDMALDFFLLFSSTAGAFGNVGQADYAAANGFMDGFAAYRNELVGAGSRAGFTLAVNWPLWREGGMQVDAGVQARMVAAGLAPLPSEAGFKALAAAFAACHSQVLVTHGRRDLLEQVLAMPAAVAVKDSVPAAGADATALHDAVAQRVVAVFSDVADLAVARIDLKASLEDYGIDSIMITALNDALAEAFPDLPKTLFFQVRSLAECVDALIEAFPGECAAWGGLLAQPATAGAQVRAPRVGPAPLRGPKTSAAPTSGLQAPIAVIGLDGRFPMAANVAAFWDNLRAGRDCISEIPAERWSLDNFYLADVKQAIAEGKSYAKWGGFLEDFGAFDPLFFNISPWEAMNIDPQERLFLMSCWSALEDAGLTRAALREHYGREVGVFAGITQTGFNLVGAELKAQGEACHYHTSFSSVANRVSYFLDVCGPSLPVDTMCSSSLTAIHEACERLRHGDCQLALAGGVNLYLHPSQFTAMSSATMLSPAGVCRSFGAGADGYVPGEGVGVVVLKRLDAAQRDGDRIHAVIRGSHVNHGGKTNGYTVPNPMAQAALIRATLDKAGINARRLGYIEAHGTGTALGDPIEVDGLTRAFRADHVEPGSCALGSAKSNIGHLEAAAGVAGLIKIILQMKHKTLVPSLHADDVNPNIDFAKTPFVLQREVASWSVATVTENGVARTFPRLAGLSSFGAGGANAHLIVEEAPTVKADGPGRVATEPAALVVLSALDHDALQRVAGELCAYLEQNERVSLTALAYTLQVGREAMAVRWALSVNNLAELCTKLRAFCNGAEPAGWYLDEPDGARPGDHGEAVRALADRDWDRLGALWVKGAVVTWADHYGDTPPQRLHLPTYPFARRVFWQTPAPVTSAAAPVQAEVTPQWALHKEVWQPAPAPATIDWVAELERYAGKRVCVVYRDRAESDALCALLRQVQQAAGCELSLDSQAVSTLVDGDFAVLPDVVLMLGPSSGPEAKPVEETDIADVFHLCRRLMKQGWGAAVEVTVVYQFDPRAPRLDCDALSGFLRSAMLENPNHAWRLIAYAGADRTAKHRILLREWLGRDQRPALQQRDLCYRDTTRYEKTMVPCAAPEVTHPVFKQRGTYLLAGGLGYIGRLLARRLAADYGATLVILGRRERSLDVDRFLRDLERAGGRAFYHRVDITDASAMRALLPGIRDAVGPLHGVINLARSHQDSMIAAKTWDQFAQVIRTKVQAGLLLDELTAAEPLDFFLMFSSLGAFGVRGSSDYAYATAFQNAFAHERKARGAAGVTVAQCWSAWEQDNLFPASRKQLEDMGFYLINMARAFPVIERSLAGGDAVPALLSVYDADRVSARLGLTPAAAEPDPWALRIDAWEQRRARGEAVVEAIVAELGEQDVAALPAALVSRLYRLLCETAPAVSAEAVVAPKSVPETLPEVAASKADSLRDQVRALVMAVLRLDHIDDDKRLQEVGLDSISAMHFATRMEKILGCEVQPQWLLDYPTVTDLTRHLDQLTASF